MSATLKSFCDAMRPPSRLPVTDWCRRFVKLPHSNKSPVWDIEGSPWLLEPMMAAADNSNREIVFVAPTGAGKTTFFEGLIPWIISEQPGNILYASQTDDTAGDWAESRLMPLLRLCKPIDNLWPKDRHKSRKTEIIFPHMAMFVGGAGESNLQEKTIRWVLLDEAWRYKPGRIQMARRRLHGAWNGRVCVLSQGGYQQSEFFKNWEQSTQAEFQYVCPGCGERKPWRLADFKWDDCRISDKKRDWKALGESIRLTCECGHETPDTAECRRALSRSGAYIATNPHGVPKHLGFHINAFALWRESWLDIIREFLEACDEKERGNIEPLKLFHMQRMAEFWKDEEIENRIALVGCGYLKLDYVNGEQIDSERHRTMTVDTQRDHYWSTVRAWRSDGTSRLLYESKILTDDSIEAVRAVYNVQPQLVFIDARYDTGRIYDLCAVRGYTALHGDGDASFPHVDAKGNKTHRAYSKIQTALSPSGKPCKFIRWSNEKAKDALILLRTGKGVAWELPDDVSDDYREQIDSEVKKPFANARTGETKDMWCRIGKRPNHLWDCEAMQIAVAMMLRILGDTSKQ